MRFAQEAYLWLLLLVPALGVLYLVASLLRRRALERFGDVGMLSRLTGSVSRSRRRLKAVVVIAGFAFLALALARPQYGSKLEMVQRKGVDLIIALDASASMLAEDVPPNRIEFAKHEMAGLIRRLRGDRVGIIVFAGDAFVQCPLTLDYGAARMFIGQIGVGTVLRPGTNVGRAIEVAITAFGSERRKSKVLVLLTDGEDLEAGAVSRAERAAREGIRIYTVGIGSGEGVPIPVRGESGELVEYKKDRSGEMVMSRLDEMTLKRVGRAAGGSYFRATFEESELDDLYRQLAAMEQAEQGSLEYTQFEDRFQYVLALALLLFVVEVVVSDRRRGTGRSLLLPVLALVIWAAPGWADAERKMRQGNALYEHEEYDEAIRVYREAQLEAPDSRELRYNIGNALYRKGTFDQAVDEYEGAARAADESLQEKAAYNIGNARFRGQQYCEAIEAYKQALRLDPGDLDAKFNLELAQDRLQQMMEQQQQQQEQRQQQQQEQQGEQQQEERGESEEGREGEEERHQDEQQREEKEQKEDEQKQEEEERRESAPDEQREEETQRPELREGELSRDEVERLLDALQEQEAKVREEMMKERAGGEGRIDRDW